ncbi:MAG TPA: prolipoprotein diacylglyceryl transferase [Ohtaekwangia sp.]|uniref:prolipoprotein diacylglyceryl transferase n=1 Tax=Ohtaekwangia sp. TaxID=2066019 RepID=UPI002F93F81B
MHPVLFEVGGLTVYSYGFMIALGAIAGVAYMVVRGKQEVGLTFDQANSLFLFIFIAAFVGGKALLFLEDASYYIQHPAKLLAGRGFVFYGSFLFAIPTMFWFFRRNKLPTYAMLDIMAVTTCLVHMFGRIGCFLAGCCYGLPTDSPLGVVYTDPACHANPKNTPLHPTQLYESGYIFLVMLVLLFLRGRRRFYGQLFLTYLLLYAIGRYALEFFRGDIERGFIIKDYLSHSQFIAVAIFVVVLYIYNRWSKRNQLSLHKKPI